MMLQRALVILFLNLMNALVVGKIVFNEIMIDPINAKLESTQWFELYNTEDTTIPLDEWTLRACINGECTYRQLSTTKSIGPFGYFVIGNMPLLAVNGGVKIDDQVTGLPMLPKDGSGKVALSFFKTGSATPGSDVKWSTDNPSQPGIYKNLSFAPGASLARINPLGFSDADNWSPSTSLINCANGSDKGTPGKINDYLCPPTLAPAMAPSKAPTKPPTKSPTKSPTKAPSEEATRSSCGLFGMSILCLSGCGMFGRFFWRLRRLRC